MSYKIESAIDERIKINRRIIEEIMCWKVVSDLSAAEELFNSAEDGKPVAFYSTDSGTIGWNLYFGPGRELHIFEPTDFPDDAAALVEAFQDLGCDVYTHSHSISDRRRRTVITIVRNGINQARAEGQDPKLVLCEAALAAIDVMKLKVSMVFTANEEIHALKESVRLAAQALNPRVNTKSAALASLKDAGVPKDDIEVKDDPIIVKMPAPAVPAIVPGGAEGMSVRLPIDKQLSLFEE